MEADDNPVKKLRRHMGLNRADFAKLIGRSHQSVTNYEGGIRVPAAVLTRLQQLAAERGFADITVELSSDDWQVRHAIEPGEAPTSAGRAAAPGNYNPRNQPWHDMLETILESGDAKAIAAVQPNLIIFYEWVARQLSPKVATKRSASRRE